MAQTILVTGGTGYIGAWVVKGLLENGHTVRLMVRNKNQQEKFKALADIADKEKGKLEIWEADLLHPGSYDEAAKGCDAIAHLASPFKLKIKDAQKELVDPALMGTTNVLNAANNSDSVKKIVLTSSVVAIYGDAVDMKDQGLKIFTEEQFNTTSSLKHQPYAYSKILAEKKAWEMEANAKWDLVVMNPAFVMGPALSKGSESESLKFMTDLLTGKMKTGVAELYMGYVDVRDVAKAHIYALENPTEGRHILAERVTDMLAFTNMIENQFPGQFKLPKSNNPKWVIALIGGLFGLTRDYVKKNVGIPVKLDNRKSIEKLHFKYIPLEKTVKDMVDQIEDSKA